MQLVTDPDGTQHRFPDDATPEEMQSALDQMYPIPQAAPEPTLMDQAKTVGQAIVEKFASIGANRPEQPPTNYQPEYKPSPGEAYVRPPERAIPTIGTQPAENPVDVVARALPFVGEYVSPQHDVEQQLREIGPSKWAQEQGFGAMTTSQAPQRDWIDTARSLAEFAIAIGPTSKGMTAGAQAIVKRFPSAAKALGEHPELIRTVLDFGAVSGMQGFNDTLAQGGSVEEALGAGARSSVAAVPLGVAFGVGIPAAMSGIAEKFQTRARTQAEAEPGYQAHRARETAAPSEDVSRETPPPPLTAETRPPTPPPPAEAAATGGAIQGEPNASEVRQVREGGRQGANREAEQLNVPARVQAEGRQENRGGTRQAQEGEVVRSSDEIQAEIDAKEIAAEKATGDPRATTPEIEALYKELQQADKRDLTQSRDALVDAVAGEISREEAVGLLRDVYDLDPDAAAAAYFAEKFTRRTAGDMGTLSKVFNWLASRRGVLNQATDTLPEFRVVSKANEPLKIVPRLGPAPAWDPKLMVTAARVADRISERLNGAPTEAGSTFEEALRRGMKGKPMRVEPARVGEPITPENAKAQADAYRAEKPQHLKQIDQDVATWAERTAKGEEPPPEVPPSTENTQTLYANPVEVVLRTYQKLAAKTADKVNRAFDNFGKVPMRDLFKDIRNLTKGDIGRVDRLARRIGEVFSLTKTPEDTKALFDFMTTRGASPEGIKDPLIRYKGRAVKRLIRWTGDALVERGILPAESVAKFADEYLPRVYLKHLLGDSAWKAMNAGKKMDLRYTLPRDVNLPEDVRMAILGEIQDAAFLAPRAISYPGKDIAIFDYFSELIDAGGRKWVDPGSFIPIRREGMKVYVDTGKEMGSTRLTEPMPEGLKPVRGKRVMPPGESRGKIQRVTPWWLQDEAVRLRGQAEHMNEPYAGMARELAAQYQRIADQVFAHKQQPRKGFKQIPKSRAYGPLRGLWVRREIADDVIGSARAVQQTDSWVDRVIGGAATYTGIWKGMHTAMNPPTQIRNFTSNMVMMHVYGGVPLPLVPVRIGEAIHEIRSNGMYWRQAKRHGVTQGTWATQEVARIERDYLELKAKGHPLNKAVDLGAIVMDTASDAYGLMEALGKTAIIIDAMKRRGMPINAAVRLADDALFDYSAIPNAVRTLRQTPIGAPFMTFYYKATGKTIETALTHPWRFIPYYAMYHGLVNTLAQMYDVEPDDVKHLQKALPKWLEERGGGMPLPYKDQHGRWQFVDIGYYFPWQVPLEVARSIAGGDVEELKNSLGVLSGPVPSMIAATLTGIDPFTGQEIRDKNETLPEQVSDMLLYAWDLNAPTFLTTFGVVSPPGLLSQALNLSYGERSGKLPQALQGYQQTHGVAYGQPALTVSQAIARLFGVNLYPIDPKISRAQNLVRMDAEMDRLTRSYNVKFNNPNIDRAEKDRLREELRARVTVLAAEMAEYSKASQVHPNLARGEDPKHGFVESVIPAAEKAADRLVNQLVPAE